MAVRLLSLAVAIACLAGSTNAQDKKGGPPDMAKMMESWTKHSTPGDHHKLFNHFVGKWEYKGKMWMDPSAEPMNMSGTSEGKTMMGGRFYTEHAVSNDPAMPFEGIGTWGYDNHTKKYFFSWIDSMSTSLTVGEGKYDPATKTMTWLSDTFDPMKSMLVKMKETSTLNADGTISKVFYTVDGGKDIKSMEMTLKRAK